MKLIKCANPNCKNKFTDQYYNKKCCCANCLKVVWTAANPDRIKKMKARAFKRVKADPDRYRRFLQRSAENKRKRRGVPERTIICPYCSRQFTARYSTRKFCSAKCRINYLHRESYRRPDGHARKVYIEGPTNPQGELQWLLKGKALLRSTKRALRNPEALQSLREVLKTADNSPN